MICTVWLRHHTLARTDWVNLTTGTCVLSLCTHRCDSYVPNHLSKFLRLLSVWSALLWRPRTEDARPNAHNIRACPQRELEIVRHTHAQQQSPPRSTTTLLRICIFSTRTRTRHFIPIPILILAPHPIIRQHTQKPLPRPPQHRKIPLPTARRADRHEPDEAQTRARTNDVRREPRDLLRIIPVCARGGTLVRGCDDPALGLLARRVELYEYAERRVRRRAMAVERVGDFG